MIVASPAKMEMKLETLCLTICTSLTQSNTGKLRLIINPNIEKNSMQIIAKTAVNKICDKGNWKKMPKTPIFTKHKGIVTIMLTPILALKIVIASIGNDLMIHS